MGHTLQDLARLADEAGWDIPAENEPAVTKQKEHKYVIASKTAYLIGVRKQYFGPDQNFDETIYSQMEMSIPARIIRHLCSIRTAIEKNYGKLNAALKAGRSNILYVEEYVPQESVTALSRLGINGICGNGDYPYKAIIELNRLISERIDNCKNLYPAWINWSYIKDLFVFKNGYTQQGTAAIADLYYANYDKYPYHCLINFTPADDGNILYNDRRFVSLLYKWNDDEFSDLSKVMDTSRQVKEKVGQFIDSAGKIDMIVDCENSDPFNLISMLGGIDKDFLEKISKLILINDERANKAWTMLGEYTDIPVQHIMTERLKESKSLVDATLVATATKEFYRDGVDSFILLSSDSDYWALIQAMPEAKYLVMVEHEKVSAGFKEALDSEGIFYCHLDDFYSGEKGNDARDDIILKDIKASLLEKSFNLKDLFAETLESMFVSMKESEEKQFYNKYLKNAYMALEEDGTVTINLK